MEDLHRLVHDIYVFLDGGDALVLQEFDLSQTQYRALMLLSADEGKTQTTLSDELLRNRSTATRLIDQLEARGLVKRLNDPTDRRTLSVVLTPQGVLLRDQARRAHLDSLQRRFSMFSQQELLVLTDLLVRLRDGLIEDTEMIYQEKGGRPTPGWK
jgi:DNA-binding MarR family transcriptional regulator